MKRKVNMCLKKFFCIISSLMLFLLNISNFIFSSEKEKKISIGISSNYWGPKKPDWWGKVGGWEEWKFYDKQAIISLLLEYKLDEKIFFTFSYPVKKYELVGGYEFKIKKEFFVDVEIKYQKVEKIKGKMKKIWSNGAKEEIIIDEDYVSGLNYGLKIKYMF